MAPMELELSIVSTAAVREIPVSEVISPTESMEPYELT